MVVLWKFCRIHRLWNKNKIPTYKWLKFPAEYLRKDVLLEQKLLKVVVRTMKTELYQ